MATAVLGLSLAVTGIGPIATPAYAAVDTQPKITQDQALSLAKQWGLIPDGYKVEGIHFADDLVESGKAPEWAIDGQTPAGDYRYIRLSADTGKLISYSRYQKKPSQGNGAAEKERTPEQLQQAAAQFLQQVTTEAERKELSKPNQYPGGERFRYFSNEPDSFVYTRIINDIPFLENGFFISVGKDGMVQSFQREWYDGSLPQEASKSESEAALAQVVQPSLAYVQVTREAGLYASADRSYSLVYRYGPQDGAMVDAQTGEVLTLQGQSLPSQPVVTPLAADDGKEPVVANKIITRDEALAIAGQLVKKLPGTYKPGNSYGSGSSQGEDGIEHKTWSFSFEKATATGKKGAEDQIELEIDDRGRLNSYSAGDSGFGQRAHEIAKPVAWDKAKQEAEALVRLLYADRLDELYISSQPPTKEEMQDIQENGRDYEISFGRLKNGIVVENSSVDVTVNAETGSVVRLSNRYDEMWTMQLPAGKAAIDVAEALKIEASHKQPMLTYYIASNYPGPYMVSSSEPKPKLVYRYVGDEGLVDAIAGEWISFNQLKQGESIQDIVDHPQQQLLQEAVDQGWLAVTDGHLYPDKPIANVDFIRGLLRFSSRSPLDSMRSEEVQIDSKWIGIDEASPDYDVIVQALRNKLIEQTGAKFASAQPITREQAAKMTLLMLGYKALLDKPELFRASFADVKDGELPAAALGQALGLFSLADGKRFAPHETLSRAEAAQLFSRLSELLD